MILDDPSMEKVIDSYGEEVRQPSSRLWRSILGEYDLDEHESVLLTEACRVADRLDRLAEESDGAR